MFRLDKATNQELESLNSTYRTAHICGETEIQRNAEGIKIGEVKHPDKIRAEIIDKATGKVYATAFADEGGDEVSAIKNGLEAARGKDRPKSPAELATENKALKDRIAQLEGGSSPARTPTVRTKKPSTAGAVRAKGKGTTTPPAKNPDDDLSAADLANALKARGLPLPEGDRRTNEWRDAAIAAINAADNSGE